MTNMQDDETPFIETPLGLLVHFNAELNRQRLPAGESHLDDESAVIIFGKNQDLKIILAKDACRWLKADGLWIPFIMENLPGKATTLPDDLLGEIRQFV